MLTDLFSTLNSSVPKIAIWLLTYHSAVQKHPQLNLNGTVSVSIAQFHPFGYCEIIDTTLINLLSEFEVKSCFQILRNSVPHLCKCLWHAFNNHTVPLLATTLWPTSHTMPIGSASSLTIVGLAPHSDGNIQSTHRLNNPIPTRIATNDNA